MSCLNIGLIVVFLCAVFPGSLLLRFSAFIDKCLFLQHRIDINAITMMVVMKPDAINATPVEDKVRVESVTIPILYKNNYALLAGPVQIAHSIAWRTF